MSISIEDITRNPELHKALAALDFVASERPEGDDDWYHIDAAERYETQGSEGAGGRFLLGQSSGRVLYLSSEGRAGVIAASLEEFLGLLVVHPYWQDLLKFSGNGQVQEMHRSVGLLRADSLDRVLNADWAARLLHKAVVLPSPDDAVERLHRAVADLSNAAVVTSPEGDVFEGLFNRFSADHLMRYAQPRGA